MSGTPITVERISVTPVKNTRLDHPASVLLGPNGVVGNRRFFLVGPDGMRLRSDATAWPSLLATSYDAEADQLAIAFDGFEVGGDAAATGETLVCEVAEAMTEVRVVPGPWEEPLSQLAGKPVRLVRCEIDGATMTEPVTLVSRASLRRFAQEAAVADLDARRFRMMLELEGCGEHEEDTWAGRRFRAGEALLEVGGPVERCAVTTRDPATGERDLDTLRLLAGYRGRRESDGAILFGVYARVVEPGRVAVGDTLEPV